MDPNCDDYGVGTQLEELPFHSWRPVLVGVLMAFLVVGLAGLGGIIWHRPRPLTADQVPERAETELQREEATRTISPR